MQLPNTLNEEQGAALIQCLRMFAAHGRALRLERARQQKTESPSNLAGAGDSVDTNDTNILAEVSTDV